jgi:ankyrin repeat protein
VTPLIAAVKNGHRDVVKALLDHGVPHGPSLYF